MQTFDQQMQRMRSGSGFIAALDQSGGSTPGALRAYGVPETAYQGDEQMYDRVHEMRTRIITSPSFDRRVLGAILFENTVDRAIEGLPTSHYLWRRKQIVPFLKVDSGLLDAADGVRLMKPMPKLDALCEKARKNEMFGTKMRSVVLKADKGGIQRVVAQQFEIGRRICAAGLVPIIEPEVDIHAPDKAAAEDLLLAEILAQLDALDGQTVMLKLTLPETDNLYRPCVEHPAVARVVALSGGYDLVEANKRLSRQTGMIASFSRALAEGLKVDLSNDEFDRRLGAAVQSIYDASVAG